MYRWIEIEDKERSTETLTIVSRIFQKQETDALGVTLWKDKWSTEGKYKKYKK